MPEPMRLPNHDYISDQVVELVQLTGRITLGLA
jgi:hypothetical protein